MYCTNSCNTRAYNARKAAQKVRQVDLSTDTAGLTAPVSVAPTGALTLDWSKQNLLVLSAASALGQLGVQLGASLLNLFMTPVAASPVEAAHRPDPLAWLPAGLLTAAAPRVVKELPALQRSFVFVELHYLGHVLYYQPKERWLLWRVVPGKLLALLSADYVDAVAEQVPYQAPEAPHPALGQAQQPPLRPKFLG
jgi:hypothetical protein